MLPKLLSVSISGIAFYSTTEYGVYGVHLGDALHTGKQIKLTILFARGS